MIISPLFSEIQDTKRQKKTSLRTSKKAVICEQSSQVAANGRQLSLSTFLKRVKQEC